MKKHIVGEERSLKPPGGPIKDAPQKVPAEVFADGAKYRKIKIEMVDR